MKSTKNIINVDIRNDVWRIINNQTCTAIRSQIWQSWSQIDKKIPFDLRIILVQLDRQIYPETNQW